MSESEIQPSVSIIIPNYNHAAYLQQRIDSVLQQTYHDFEVIILDDCSTDNSRQIIEQYRDNKKISTIIYNSENSGSTFKQWDKGIQTAKGKYIWIAESDDWCEKNFLETIITGIEKNEDVVFGYCQGFCVNNEGKILFQSGYSKLEDYYPAENFVEDFLCFGNAVYNASMAVFKKDCYFKINKYFQSFKFTGDWILWAELSRLGPVYINAKPLNYFRKHDKDVSGKMYATGLNFIEEIKALDYFHESLHLNKSLHFKAKVRLYNRFLPGKNNIDRVLKNQIKRSFFSNASFIKKQYFLILSGLYNIKTALNKKLNTSFKAH